MTPGPIISDITVANLTQTSAELHATVNPHGVNTTVSFFTLSSGPLGTVNVGSGNSGVALPPYTLTGLNPGNLYKFKVFAVDTNNLTAESGWVSFITASSASGAPVITSATVSNITQTTAVLHGTVNPTGYDTNVSYFLISGFPFGTVDIGNGTTGVTLPPYTLTGLTPGTNYEFKVFAVNTNATVDGQWVSFTTLGSNNSCTTPTISSISPNHVTVGSGTTIVTVTGSNFINGTSSAEINGSPRTTNFSNSTSLDMTLTSSDVASSGTESITVNNGSGCDSNAVTFTINPTSNGGGGGGGGGSGGSYFYASVITLNAMGISANSAILNGTINPNGRTTTSWFEYGTSSNLSTPIETIHVNQGSGTSAGALAQNISGLAPSTTYYFRAVANNTYGTIKGNTYSFTTGIRNGTAITVQATSQSVTSAKLNGLFINPNNTSATGHFEYGTTASLGNRTADKDLGTYSSVRFSNFVTNLSPNTIYFFRAIVNNQGATDNGNILVFKTSAEGINTPPAEPVNVEPTVVTTESSILKITNEKDEIAIGDEVNYLVTFKNTDSKNFENAKLSVQLPKEIDFVESNFGKLNSDNDAVEFDPGILVPDQVGSMTIKGKVNSKAQGSDILITTAIMSYNLTGSTESKDEIAYATNHVIEGIGLQANALFGTSFLPSTLLGWFVLILIILGLAVVGKNLYSTYAVKNSNEKTSNHTDNLPM